MQQVTPRLRRRDMRAIETTFNRAAVRAACATLASIALMFAAAAAAASGADIARKCDQCHGDNGHSKTEDIPSIGGFSEFGIVDLLDSYRNGNRQARAVALPDGTETDMQEIAQSLSEDDTMAAAEHYAAQTWQPHEQTFDAALARRGAAIHDIKCDKCHSEGGGVKDDDLAIMSGQWRQYLEMEIQDFDAGTRKMAPKMQDKYKTLSADDKKAIVEMYISAGRR
jgi:sulfide dehydrogenase cytochrome subunit